MVAVPSHVMMAQRSMSALGPDSRPERTTADELYEMLQLPARPAWQADALCREPEYSHINFVPDTGQRADAAKAVCARCLVRAECLSFALDGDDVGVWGGTTDRERRGMPRKRKVIEASCTECGRTFEATRRGFPRCAPCRKENERRYRAEAQRRRRAAA